MKDIFKFLQLMLIKIRRMTHFFYLKLDININCFLQRVSYNCYACRQPVCTSVTSIHSVWIYHSIAIRHISSKGVRQWCNRWYMWQNTSTPCKNGNHHLVEYCKNLHNLQNSHKYYIKTTIESILKIWNNSFSVLVTRNILERIL